MISRPGIASISHFIAFKEGIHHTISEAPELDPDKLTEDEKRRQVMNDLQAKDTDVLREKIMKEHKAM